MEERLGCQVDWRLFGTGPAIVDAFEKKALDIAYVGLPPVIIGIERGVRIKCIAGGHIEGTVFCGESGSAGFPRETDLSKILSQFRGRSIGVPGRGSIHDVILKDVMDRHGLSGKINVINFAWSDQITEAAVKGDLAAAVGTPALAAALRRYKGFTPLYPPAMIWPYNPSYGIIADQNFLLAERGVAGEFLRLHEDAARSLRDDPSGAAGTISGYVGFIDSEFVLETLKISPKYCAALPYEYIAATMKFAACLKRLGYIRKDVSVDDIFDTSLISEKHPEKDHYDPAA